MPTALQFIITKNWIRAMPMNHWHCDLSTEQDAAYKHELLLYATTWMNCPDIMLKEHMCSIFCLIVLIRWAKLISADRGWIVGSGKMGRKNKATDWVEP